MRFQQFLLLGALFSYLLIISGCAKNNQKANKDSAKVREIQLLGPTESEVAQQTCEALKQTKNFIRPGFEYLFSINQNKCGDQTMQKYSFESILKENNQKWTFEPKRGNSQQVPNSKYFAEMVFHDTEPFTELCKNVISSNNPTENTLFQGMKVLQYTFSYPQTDKSLALVNVITAYLEKPDIKNKFIVTKVETFKVLLKETYGQNANEFYPPGTIIEQSSEETCPSDLKNKEKAKTIQTLQSIHL